MSGSSGDRGRDRGALARRRGADGFAAAGGAVPHGRRASDRSAAAERGPAALAARARRYRAACARYFDQARGDIDARNALACRIMSAAAPPLLVLFLFSARVLGPFWRPSPWHLAAVPALVAVALAAWRLTAPRRRARPSVTAVCLGFASAVLALTALVDTLGTPLVPGLFMQALCVVMTGMFVFRPGACLSAVGLLEILFAALSFAVKEPFAARGDAVSAVAGFSICVGVSLTATALRVREFEAGAAYRVLSTRDVLTGLANKATLLSRAAHYVDEAGGAVSCALVMIDVDDFKRINDRYGHLVGDEVLRGVGSILADSFRSSDVLARFGGDEFTVLAKGFVDEGALAGKLAAIQGRMRELGRSLLGEEAALSMGAVVARARPVDLDRLLRLADDALYVSKRAGKARFTVTAYTDEEAAVGGWPDAAPGPVAGGPPADRPVAASDPTPAGPAADRPAAASDPTPGPVPAGPAADRPAAASGPTPAGLPFDRPAGPPANCPDDDCEVRDDR